MLRFLQEAFATKRKWMSSAGEKALKTKPSQDKCFHLGKEEELGDEMLSVSHANTLSVKGIC